MSEENLSSKEDSAPASAGGLLTVAREKQGLSVVDVARQLNLTARQVMALESDDFEALPGTVFVYGFLRNYARLLKLDPAPLLAYAQRRRPMTPPAVPKLQQEISIAIVAQRRWGWRAYTMAALVLLLPMLAVAFYKIALSPLGMPAPEVIAMAPSASPTLIVNDAAPILESSASSVTVPAAQTSPSAKAEEARRSATANPGVHVLKLKFDRESWVEIRDGSGRKIFSQLNPAGTEQAVSGLPPLFLVVGNAAGVHLAHNDQPVNLSPHIKVDVARLTLE